jgi:ATP/maltotriose-dependent transcriptional regulator MalT
MGRSYRPTNASAGSVDELARGRMCYERRAWSDAYRALSLADQAAPLEAADLELLAMSAYLIGRDNDYLVALERAHQAHLDSSERLSAIRCAFWLSLRLLFRGEMGRATGWLRRAQRSLEPEDGDCAERGYLMLPAVIQHFAAGDGDAAHASAAGAADIGERCGDTELVAIARHLQGRALIQQGQIAKGFSLLDEAMLAVTTKELSPLVSGLIYCSLIDACQEVYALSRAREWTLALHRWCARQQQLVAFTGLCHVHRAEIMQLSGAWREAIEEARRACERCLQAGNQPAAAAALYQQAEVHRLRGEFAPAEEAYRKASQGGREPQPGLALLRLAQGRTEVAAAAIRGAMSGTADRLQRTRLLAACVEIMLAAGDLAAADNACRELEQIAHELDAEVLKAMAAQAHGSVELAKGDAQAALGSLRQAFELWQRVDIPYVAARVRVLIGMACRALGDEDGAELAQNAARAIFQQLGAAPDLARIDPPTQRAGSTHTHRLTARELQVLRLVATGRTNKAIAAELRLSEKTIDRHMSNIFDKLDVPSRAAATALAYERKLI